MKNKGKTKQETNWAGPLDLLLDAFYVKQRREARMNTTTGPAQYNEHACFLVQ